jgi:DNA polymerase (family 10)
MVAAARERGYEYHAITDHSKALAMTNGLDARRLREQGKEIAEVQAEFPNVKNSARHRMRHSARRHARPG